MASPARQAEAPDQGVAPLGDLWVDRDAEVPIGVQLAWAIKTRIAEGSLSGGQRLPGLRDLAEDLGINANTVRAVYAKLERDGLLESRQGSGTFVALGEGRQQKASRIAARAAREATAADVDPRDVASILYVRAPAPGSTGAQAGRRGSLRAQIATLEQALGELEAEHPALAQSTRRRHPAPTARTQAGLPSTAELEEVKSSLLRRLSAIQAEMDALRQAPPPEPARRAKPAPGARRSRVSAQAPSKPARAGTSRTSGGGSRPAPAGA